jgi:Tfp pilus assembly protein PilX
MQNLQNNQKGSVFLLAVTAMTVLFILGFSLTFFTGSEDYASAMSYESEVAFNLAESAVEEFVARLKNSLNHDDANNQLYKGCPIDCLYP